MIVNLTPHTVNIVTNDMEMATKSSGVVRCSQENTPICTIDGIPITATTYGEVEGLPDYPKRRKTPWFTYGDIRRKFLTVAIYRL